MPERQRNLFRKPEAKTSSSLCNESREDDLEQTVVQSLFDRFQELNEEDCDIKSLVLLAGELRQWLFTSKKLELQESAQTALSTDLSDAL